MDNANAAAAAGSGSVELKEFFIFNPTFGNDHDDELGKILYYYPSDVHEDTQLKHVGLCEAIIRFSENFNCDIPCEALHTQKLRYVFLQPEPNFWFALVLRIPAMIKNSPDGIELIDYHDDQVQTNVFKAVLLKLYSKFILRNNNLETFVKTLGLEVLKEALQKSFLANLSKIESNQCGIAEIFYGLQFLPVDRHMFLKVQCFINQLLLTFSQIKHLILLQGEKLIWTGIGQNDIQVLYEYLIKELLSQHFLCGPYKHSTFGFIVKKRSHVSLFDPPPLKPALINSSNGNGITTKTVDEGNGGSDDAENSGDSFFTASPSSAAPSRKGSKVNLTELQRTRKRFHILIYKAEQSFMTMFLNDSDELDSTFMMNLESFLSVNFCPLAKILARDYSSANGIPISTGFASSIISSFQSSPSSYESIPPNVKFLYFNNLNLAVKLSPGSHCELDSYRMLADLKEDFQGISENGEVVTKMVGEPCPWIVAKISNGREFYAMFNSKTSNNLTDIDEEVKKLTDTHLNNIFFQD